MKPNRNALLLALLACAAISEATAASALPVQTWQFDVTLDGKSIGHHSFELQQQEDNRTVLTSEAHFDVKLLFINAFRYRHQSTEVWDDRCLVRLDASTNNNDTILGVRGEINDGRFDLRSVDGASTLPECVQTFAYWNPAILESQKLLNSQTGNYEDVYATFVGKGRVTVAGTTVEALEYRLATPAGDITLWYSASEKVWVGLEAPAKGGRRITYTAISVPETGPSASILANRGEAVSRAPAGVIGGE
jgi:Domain of unknown function (DUF6134)